MKTTKIFSKTLKACRKAKLIISYGASGSSKTVSAMQVFFTIAANKPKQQIFFFAQTVPKLNNTLIEDFKRNVTGEEFFIAHFHNQTKTLQLPNGSKIIFASADDPDKVIGVRSDYILFDEINTFRHGERIFKNLFARCRGVVIVAFNPASKFWISDYMGEDFATVIHSTYKDNPYIPKSTLQNLLYLSAKDENFKKVYLLGEWGAMQGVIFKFKENWDYFTVKPKNYDAKYYAGDFGFTNDPSTLIEIIKDGDNLYLTELMYKKGMLNKDIANCVKKLNIKDPIIFDSAEPKSIAELRRLGIKAITAVKGADSIKKGIDSLKSYNLFVNIKSKNLINEFFNYAWAYDKKTNEPLNVPIDDYNHLIDPARYIVLKYRL